MESKIFGGSITSNYYPDLKRAVIIITGEFNFNIQKHFRECYTSFYEYEVEELTVDLGACIYMDSAALGMILLLKEDKHFKEGRIEIANTSAQVKQLLEIANFNKFGFVIS